jgi:excisionase family DNA binding protein
MSALKQKAGLPAGSQRPYPPILPRLLSVLEVAELTGFKVQTVYAWIAARRLPVVRLGRGRAVRVPSDALAALIAANTTPVRPEGGGR